jgi:hypothetical protein
MTSSKTMGHSIISEKKFSAEGYLLARVGVTGDLE